jgi:hypothetical protein
VIVVVKCGMWFLRRRYWSARVCRFKVRSPEVCEWRVQEGVAAGSVWVMVGV